MSDRLLKNLAIVLVILAAGYAIIRVASGLSGSPGSAPFELASVSGAEIDSVVIVSADETVRVRGGDEWTVNGFEAIPQSGEALERALSESRLDQVISKNPQNHDRLGVAEGQGNLVTVYSGGEAVVELIVSDKGRSGRDAYVRRPGDDEVYPLRGNLVDLARRDADGWRNIQITEFAVEDVQRVEFSYADESFQLVRVDTASWRIEPSGAMASTAATSSVLRQLSNLRSISFPPDSETDSLSWDPPTARVRVLGPGDAVLGDVTLLKKTETGYYGRRTGQPVVYNVSNYSGSQILKREADLAAAEE